MWGNTDRFPFITGLGLSVKIAMTPITYRTTMSANQYPRLLQLFKNNNEFIQSGMKGMRRYIILQLLRCYQYSIHISCGEDGWSDVISRAHSLTPTPDRQERVHRRLVQVFKVFHNTSIEGVEPDTPPQKIKLPRRVNSFRDFSAFQFLSQMLYVLGSRPIDTRSQQPSHVPSVSENLRR